MKAAGVDSTSPNVIGLAGGEPRFDVRGPDGNRFGRKQVTEHQARLLVAGGVCDEKRSPKGLLRYLQMRRSPSMKKFAQILAQSDFTISKTGNLYEHGWTADGRVEHHPYGQDERCRESGL